MLLLLFKIANTLVSIDKQAVSFDENLTNDYLIELILQIE